MTEAAARATPRLTLQAAAAATAPVVAPVVLVELDFATGPFRVWTGLGPLDWAGKMFEGAASIGAISDVEETVEPVFVKGVVRCPSRGVSDFLDAGVALGVETDVADRCPVSDLA